MRYYANPSSPRVRAAMNAGQLGMISTPAQGNAVPPQAGWVADNGCGPGKGGKPGKGYPGDAGWLRWLDSFTAEERSRCAFAVAPDVVGDAQATWNRSAPWLPVIRSMGYRAALVAQNGLELLQVQWDAFDVLFLGGDTEWKLGPHARRLAAEARRRGKPVHMGRVNSEKRFRYAHAIGCSSVDGTYIAFGPDLNLRDVLAWHRGITDTLFDMEEEEAS